MQIAGDSGVVSTPAASAFQQIAPGQHERMKQEDQSKFDAGKSSPAKENGKGDFLDIKV